MDKHDVFGWALEKILLGGTDKEEWELSPSHKDNLMFNAILGRVAGELVAAKEKRKKRRPLVVAITGAVGSGKTTAMETVASRSRGGQIVAVTESIGEWGELLGLALRHPQVFELAFFAAVVTDQVRAVRNIGNTEAEAPPAMVLVERSPRSRLCVFTKMARDANRITEKQFQLAEKLIESLTWKQDLHLHLRASPETCRGRIKKRNRACEKAYDHEYVTKMTVYENRLAEVADHTIDVDGDVSPERVATWLETRTREALGSPLLAPRNVVLAVSGSRYCTDEQFVHTGIDKWATKHGGLPQKILHGGCRGVDTHVASYVAAHPDIATEVYLPDWKEYGRAAGPIRNARMLKDSTHLLAFPCKDPSKSKGTMSAIASAEKQGRCVDRFDLPPSSCTFC